MPFFSVGSCHFLSNAFFRLAGSIPAESGSPYDEQYTWGWRGCARDFSEFESRLWVAGE